MSNVSNEAPPKVNPLAPVAPRPAGVGAQTLQAGARPVVGGPPPPARRAATIMGVGLEPKPLPPAPPVEAAPLAFDATVAEPPPPAPAAFDPSAATLDASSVAGSALVAQAHSAPFVDTAATLHAGAAGGAVLAASLGRTTLGVLSALPRVELANGQPTLFPHDKPRFEEIRVLGEGGMGEVALVHDEDIDRTVAVKRLRPDLQHPVAIARFVDEVRTVGRLEHPNIVPLHDVGLDAQGRFYFVMKYVEGETLEEIIEKLAAGSPATMQKYTFEVRVQIFLSLLRALEYAHAKGIIHRDIKPANVMVGRYGEVVLMDWGIAKPVGSSALDLASAALPPGVGGKTNGNRTLQTALGVLVGTPAYMSPEQARGENDKLDVRSDLYSVTALFYELMTTHHYLGAPAPQSLEELLTAVRERQLLPPGNAAHDGVHQGPPPAEWMHFCRHGLEKEPAKRYQSAAEMIERVQHVLDGRVPVNCPVTFTKRVTRESGRFVDRHPLAAVTALFGSMALGLWTVVATVMVLVR